MTNQLKNPFFWYVILFAGGMVIGALGWIKEDCIGPNCWKGSGFIKWTGIIAGVIGLIAMATTWGKKK
jgi:hypothetical protein